MCVYEFSDIIIYMVQVVQVTSGLFLFSTAGIYLSGRWGAPWVITPELTIDRMLDLAELKEGEMLVDLGAGDGRILIAAAKKYGIAGRGVEIDPVRWLLAKLFIWCKGVRGLVKMEWGNLYEADLSDADVVMLHLTRETNLKLKNLLEKQLRTGARVVSYAFPIPGWTPTLIDNIKLIFVYEIGKTGDNTVTQFVSQA